jgi:hypothetical protein
MAIFRYEKSQERRNANNKKTLATGIPATIKRNVQDIYIYTRVGDRLDLLASQYYGDRTKWVYLAAANKLKEMVVEPGIQLRIPFDATVVEQEWEKQNTDR